MTSYCLQLVEFYGNQTLVLPIDSKIRLKLAVKYLLLATQLSNMNRDIHRNSLSVASDTSISCPESIESLLISISSSSIYGNDPKLLPSNNITKKIDNPPPETPKGGGASGKSKGGGGSGGSGGASSTSSKKAFESSGNLIGKPTLRDAILMLSSLSRESIPFCLDSPEYLLQYDLLNLIKKSFDGVRSKYFISSLPNTNDELTIPESSLTSLWIPTSEVPISKIEQVDYHRSCMYPGVIGYLLLGPIKDSTTGTFLTPSSEPFLTKVNLTRQQIIENELFYLRLKEKLQKFQKNDRKPIEKFYELLNEIKERLTLLFFLLRGIEPSKKDLEVFQLEYIESTNQFIFQVIVSGKNICELNLLDDGVLSSFSLFLSNERACSTMKCDKSVLLYLWAAFKS